MFFFLQSFQKSFYYFYNFYLFLSLYQIQSLTFTIRNDDNTSYDLIVNLLNGFKTLVDCFGVDYLVYLRVNYLMRNLSQGVFLGISLLVFNSKINTGTYYYNVLDWYEREVWDMYGIIFTNHPDLTRILTDYGFQGFPLRKEFPLTGFYELFYNGELNIIEQRKLFLKQDYNFFNTDNSWYF